LALPSFLEEVLAGLSRRRKALPPKYFYDTAGSRLFERICRLPEYYLTRAELSLTRLHLKEIASFAGKGCELVEYGSGEGLKTRLLIRALRPSVYVPVDISASALAGASRRLAREFRWLRILPVKGDFSRSVTLPAAASRQRRVVYFPGSTIGNLSPREARAFLARSRRQASRMLVGTDLKKDAAVLHAAYNDARGVTAAFNLNVLRRINRELGGDFDLKRFAHRATYDASLGRIEMHLVSLERQQVRVARQEFSFGPGETIHTENSYKYTPAEFRALAARSGFRTKKLWLDRAGRFALHGLVDSRG
jgi:L-histidine N-alpha-methyltransferase